MTEARTAIPENALEAAQAGKARVSRKKGKGGAAKRTKATKGNVSPTTAKGSAKDRADTKQEKLIAMLRRKEGTTIDEIVKAFGWQPHTVRGALAGALKKKLGLQIESEKVEGHGRVYRIQS